MVETRLTGRIFLAAATLAGTALAPALANAEPAAEANWSTLNLTVSSANRDEVPRNAVLNCHPAGGTHPHAASACQTLNAVGGDLTKLTEAQSTCNFIHKPVTYTARGTWQGRPVTFEKTYSNKCIADASTGKVFAF
ncbi:Subtilisin inhibitor-like [Saccharopolyspora kobensis]|uniref:Subtilisin inhibitor-like n=1 Tax=Saccharopolyspora kobensis TaxID=146035 RepID=A0A1H6EIB4_9PSEU|nr:SSI family serine proteinase inhibitor [Saccharopolyspora kobensis]SEG97033.1 Subtilisin inhibitor-like [Saccharopolyspora kobensis]SFE65719.1 Subtilisin inhibitor-like [Saccharopolyspora kobensis]